jgi:putative ABC transport system permease protein
MYKSYLIIAWRNLWKNRTFSAINIAGLALGMSCSLLILLWVNDERSVDGFHANKANLYTIIQRTYANDKMGIGYYTPGPLAEEMKKTLPEVQEAVTYSNWGNTGTFQAGDKIIKEKGEYAGEAFFRLFSFPLLQGDKASALNAIPDIAISKKMATSFFGSPETAIGKTIRFENKQNFTVSAVFDELPAGSSLQFDYLINWAWFARENDWTKDWNSVSPYTSVLLRPDADPERFRSRIRHFLDNRNTKQGPDYRVELDMQRFDMMYLHGDFKNKEIGGGRIEYVRLFSLIAFGILLIGCINFMNLATARSVQRAKEIGVRKTAGATRGALVRQFIGEAILCALLAAAVSMVLVILLLPMFNELSGKQMSLPFASAGFWLQLMGITLVTGLIAGSYPAFFLSALNPVRALKGDRGGGSSVRFGNGAALFRQGLVVFQFVLSLLLIIGTLVVSQQVKFIRARDLGFDREGLVTIPLEGALVKQYPLLKEQVERMPGILGVTSLSQELVQSENYWVNDVHWEGISAHATSAFALMYTGYDFIATLHLQLEQGRDFSRGFATDSTGYLLNESAIKKTGLVNPVGQPFTCLGKKGTIIGVVKDFHFNSLHEAIAPLIIAFDESAGSTILIRTAAGKTPQALAGLEAECRKLNPEFPFTYQFPDEAYGRVYRNEAMTGQLSYVFASLAIFISCLGLLGLAIFTAEQRSKEIAIRKVLGAGLGQLFALLFRGFFRLVLIAFVIAAPFSRWMMGKWLEGYAYRAGISWWIFPLAGGLTLLIAFLTVGSQLMKAAGAAPIKSIKAQ